ncbi:MAG: antibiotic biosynthesis monooxygenase [Pseudonocardiales bacterium]|nr:antibiotic biosynthesis monooxygenase [Pseudonocardiales bacterium]
MPVTSIFDIHLGPEPLPAIYNVIHDVAAQTRGYPGNTGVQVLVDQTDPRHMVVIGAWNTFDEFTDYETWRAGDGAPQDLIALLAEPPASSHYVPAPTEIPVRPTTMEGTS